MGRLQGLRREPLPDGRACSCAIEPACQREQYRQQDQNSMAPPMNDETLQRIQPATFVDSFFREDLSATVADTSKLPASMEEDGWYRDMKMQVQQEDCECSEYGVSATALLEAHRS